MKNFPKTLKWNIKLFINWNTNWSYFYDQSWNWNTCTNVWSITIQRKWSVNTIPFWTSQSIWVPDMSWLQTLSFWIKPSSASLDIFTFRTWVKVSTTYSAPALTIWTTWLTNESIYINKFNWSDNKHIDYNTQTQWAHVVITFDAETTSWWFFYNNAAALAWTLANIMFFDKKLSQIEIDQLYYSQYIK